MGDRAIKAIAYCRTSSAANVGADKDSRRRQLEAIRAYAKRAGIEIVDEFYDAAVSGEDAIHTRPGFAAMMKRIEGNGARTIIVETASRFARDLMVQEVGFRLLKERGVDLIAADSPASFLDDGPSSNLIRQVLGAVAEFEKAMLVAKLKGARDRKRKTTGLKVEGRKSIAERDGGVTIALEARRLYRKNPKTGERRSLRKVSAELAKQGARREQRATVFADRGPASYRERHLHCRGGRQGGEPHPRMMRLRRMASGGLARRRNRAESPRSVRCGLQERGVAA